MTYNSPKGHYFYAQSPLIYSLFDTGFAAANFNYRILVRIWQGELVDEPATIQYDLSKTPDTNNVAIFDISSLLRDFFVSPQYTFDNAGDTTELTVWVKVILGHNIGSGSITGEHHLDAVTALNGYTFYSELSETLTSENFWNSIVTDFDDRRFDDSGFSESLSCIPLAYDSRSVSFFTDRPLETTIPSDTSMGMFIGKDGAATRVAISINSGASTKYINLDSFTAKVFRIGSGTTEVSALFSPTVVTDYQIWAEAGGEVLSSVYSFTVEEPCRYGFKNLQFLNRFGVWDNILFYGTRIESINVDRTEILNSSLTSDSTTDIFFTEQQGQFRMKSINGRENLTISTGWISQEWNELIRQLMLTSSLYDVDTLQPYTLETTELIFKTALNNGLSDYTIILKQGNTATNTVF